MYKRKIMLGVIIGIIVAVLVFCVAVSIGCAINGVGFGEQIANWFGVSAPAVDEVLENIPTTPIV